MLIRFLLALRNAGLKISVTEFLALLEALKAGFARHSVDDFYALARATLIKDESKYDLFDRAFSAYFQGVQNLSEDWLKEIPDEWLKKEIERHFSEQELARIQALGGIDELMKQLQERMQEQKARHQGGNRWIGTAGTSPFGNAGANPMGVRVGGQSQGRSAVKVWDRREFKNLDEEVELNTRNLKVALRQLRRFARTGATEELDLDHTISGTAKNGGWLDLHFVPERHNAVKILLFLDIGGSMDDHIHLCEELFSAAKSEFKHLEHFYFHNCLYDRVWKDNRTRYSDLTKTHDILHKFGADYRVIFVGDASMAPYELTSDGGSIEHWNEETGESWLRRVNAIYHRAVWLNPLPERQWDYAYTVNAIRDIFARRMYPMTLEGLSRAIRALQTGHA